MKKTLIVLLYMICITLPIVLRYSATLPRLAGDKSHLTYPHFYLKSFAAGAFQDSISQYEEERNGLRNILVRTNNEINYKLLHKGSGMIVPGKGDYLFSEDYIQAHLGVGADSNKIKEGFLKFDSLYELLQSHHIKLMYVVAAGKASFDREQIEDHYLKQRQAYSNYDIIRRSLPDQPFATIDFQAYFDKIKATSPHALFPKHGLHWSTYGSSVALDSIVKKMQPMLGIRMPYISSEKDIDTIAPRRGAWDADLQECLNLLVPMYIDTLTYRDATFVEEGDGIKKPKVLIVGDSYGLSFNTTRLVQHYFDAGSRVWSYLDRQNTLSPEPEWTPKLSSLNLKEEILKYDIVIFVSTEINYVRMDYGLYDKIK
ncbi:MAG: sugar O-acetyltransferase precursor [Bacteroidetes bacterium]|nr:sugar O-acetyltransferase precursor [Bacteroidota bacterium]